MAELYPAIEPFATGLLPVGDGQVLYWESVGSRDGRPALYLHGGPGSGVRPGARRYFDPARYRAVLFDQRGCGRSTPRAGDPDTDLSTNTTQHLVADIERLREHLGIDHWLVYGTSWGVTLALVYAQACPERVDALVLAAVTAGRRLEVDWILRDMGRVFPREWDEFVSLVPAAAADGNIAAAYAQLLADPDPGVRRRAALAWCVWEDTHVSLMPDWEPWMQTLDADEQLTLTRLVTHYWGNDCFLAKDQVFAAIDRVADIPATLIHGRYDVSGPLDTAWRLHQAWPASELVVVEDAGHGGGGFGSAIVQALDRYAVTS
jgi:proline iminopeptidase